MTTLAFDTFRFANPLKGAGISDQQAELLAEAQAGVLSDAMDGQLATKKEINDIRPEMAGIRPDASNLNAEIKQEFSKCRSDLRVMRWMLTLSLAGTAGIITMLLKLLIH